MYAESMVKIIAYEDSKSTKGIFCVCVSQAVVAVGGFGNMWQHCEDEGRIYGIK